MENREIEEAGNGEAMRVLVDCDDRLPLVDFEKLAPLQGALKSLSQENFDKLRKSILTRGFFVPVFIWHDGKKTHVIDGHQRLRVLSVLKRDGYHIPKIPYVAVNARNIDEAKAKILAVSSTFGKIERDGLYEFLEGMSMPVVITDFALPEIEFDSRKFLEEFYVDVDPEKSAVGAQEISSKRFETFTTACPRCKFEFDAKRKDDE